MTLQYSGGGGGSSTLAGDTDVAIASPANLQQLQYQTGDSKWHNVAGGLVRLDEKIADGTAQSITFSAISGAYRHLRIFFQCRSDVASSALDLFLQFNGDTGSNYDSLKYLYTQSGTTPGERIAQTVATVSTCPGSTSPAASAGSGELFIPYYAGTTFRKQYRATSFYIGLESTGNFGGSQDAGEWRSTAAITSIALFFAAGNGNLVSGSSFSLYGMP